MATSRMVDLTNVKEGGSFNKKRLPAGDYLARILKVADAEVKNGDNKGQPQWLFTMVLEKHPSARYPYYCTLVENQLWKIRNLMVAAGINVPKKKVKIDPERLVGKLVAVSLEDDEYDNKKQSVIASIFPPSEMADGDLPDADDDDDVDDEDTDEEEETTEEDEGESYTWDDLANATRAELKTLNTENELGIKVVKSMTDDDLRLAVAAAIGVTPEVEDDDDEEDEEEEAKPVTRKRKAKAKTITDDELEELDIEDL